jgi:acetyl-CoA synthetase/medium-chain acyl-CoA synthetase
LGWTEICNGFKAKRLMVTSPLQTLDDYRRLCASFRLEVPEHFNFGNDVFDRWASQRPDDRAMLWSDDQGINRSLTFRELADRSNQVANGMVALGLQRGDQILLELPSIVAWWELMLGLTKADMIPVPGTTLLTEKDIAYRVQAAEIDAVVTDVAGAERVDHVASELSGLKRRILVGEGERPGWIRYEELVGAASTQWKPIQTRSDGPALMYFTSGTTGLPKMVLHTHASYGIGHNLTARFWLGLQHNDLHWNISDTGWAKTAYSGFFGPWIAGAAIYVLHHTGKFDATRVLACLSTYPISSLCAPPTVYRMLVQQDLAAFRPLALRRCMAAGEPLNVTVLKRWQQATGLTIREGYGQTETVILCANIPQLPVKPGSMGLPPPGIRLAVLGEDATPLPAGEPGEIAVRVDPERPVGLFQEYWHAEAATAKCFRNGWYLTGDCAYTDSEGYFWFIARSDDVITSAAYRIGPFEVENALMQHPAVAEVAVVGKADPERTEIVKAFIVLAAGYSPSDQLRVELQNHTKQVTAPYKYPREIEFLDELPKTASGKIRRTELRKQG